MRESSEMTVAVFVIFLGGAADAHEAELEAWARARQVRIEIPDRDAAPSTSYAPEIARQIEELLDQARLELAAEADAAARERLERAERLLRRHPELPQAAWLMAERWELEAVAAERAPGAAERVAELRARRAVLEPDRALTFGQAPSQRVRASARRRVVSGLASGDRLFWNGVESARKLELATGEHHVRVIRRGALRWSGWVTVDSETARVELPVPQPSACSIDDIGAVRIAGDRVIAPADASCERWAVARPSRVRGIEIASCRLASCGPLVTWQKGYGAIYEGPPQPPPKAGFPTWATATLVGVGAVVVGGIIAWRAGAFDEPEQPAPSWRFYGP